MRVNFFRFFQKLIRSLQNADFCLHSHWFEILSPSPDRQSRATISAMIAIFEITKWRNLIENFCLHFYSESWKTSKIKISEIMKLEWKRVKIPFKMGSSFYNKNRMVLADYMNSYFSHKSTDCTIYSDDGYEFPIHKVSFLFFFRSHT